MAEIPGARLVGISLDCPDPQRLADFYRGLLGGRQLWAKESSVGIEVPGAVLVAQQVDGYVPPDWPGKKAANNITNRALDPISKIPEFKVCACRVEKAQ